MDKAPRDREITLFLPAAEFEHDEHGRPKPDTIKHIECLGIWDATQSHWVRWKTGEKVYPSQWRPAEPEHGKNTL